MRVAIIGAGISGLYLAWKLSQKGNEVVVFEKKSFIGNDVCSGLFSERILEMMPECRDLIEKEIKSVFIHFDRKTIQANFSRSFYVISHFKLDNLAESLAEQSKAEIRLNSSIDSIPQGFDRIIGCDGFDSYVRKTLKLREPVMRLGIKGFLKESANEEVEVWPRKTGFIWKMPKEKSVEYGVIANPNLAMPALKEFLKEKELNDIKSKMIPQGLIIPKNEKITLCGDAAGLTKPWSGGGVVWGMIAANFLIESFPDFGEYKKKVERFFMPKIILSKTAVKIIDAFGNGLSAFAPKKIKIESDFLF